MKSLKNERRIESHYEDYQSDYEEKNSKLFEYTCGMCGLSVDYENIISHSCGEQTSLDKNLYFYPNKIDDTDIFIDEENQNTVTAEFDGSGLERTLIHLIKKREPLWNLRLPKEERNKDLRAKLWAEVHALCHGIHDLTFLKKKWKNLVDTHRRLVINERCTNGTKSRKKVYPWIYYNDMAFMKPIILDERQLDSNSENLALINIDDFLPTENFKSMEERLETESNNFDLDVAEVQGNFRKHSKHSQVNFPSPVISSSSTEAAAFSHLMEIKLNAIQDEDKRRKVMQKLYIMLDTELYQLRKKRKTY